jgi:hypothetical protein
VRRTDNEHRAQWSQPAVGGYASGFREPPPVSLSRSL